MLAEIVDTFRDNNINIKDIAAYGKNNEAKFMVIADREKEELVLKALKGKGYVATEKEVVLLKIINEVGALSEAADKIKSSGVDLEYIYGTTCDCSCDCQLVISSNDNKKVVEILSK
ncbi:MAG: hypothetical protein COV72_02630 [Candidatus Omnitrophica bacterium CG11_big_fil_rev_8_21_14_0_20_42_13]|uniref:ACT domain-containing protein n=1 Tax=Candidatus Ghiorseimicrobium undicola TaxID=1974746 RepID=A0A2H0LYR6_9BACT|nr:MAG: hypothetical protein COV72_02630 [Candidatus Omnitrophica bacterium CG11_big_fil_rev_8_21_14_0_20_42_13]